MSGVIQNGALNAVGYTNNTSVTDDVGTLFNLILDVPPTFDVSALSIDTSEPYAGVTTATVTVSNSTAYYGGSISSVAFTIGNQTETLSGDGTLSIALDTGGTFTPTVTVTDSRGQTANFDFEPMVVKVYTPPSVSFDVERTDSTGTPDDEGTYGLIEATLTFADVIADAIAPSVVLTDENGTQTTPTVTWYTDDTLTTTVTWANVATGDTVYGLFSGVNTQYSYNVSVRPRDSQGTGTAISQTISAAFYTVDFYAGGHGIAFGKPASNAGFECAMDASFIDANGTMRALFDFIYPVGSYYETSDTTFDPNITWGGTWSLEAEGLVHIGAGSNYTVGDTGGKKSVMLSASIGSALGRADSINFIAEGVNGYQSGHNGTYAVFGSNLYNLGWSHSTPVTEFDSSSRNTSIMQPYIVVNRWHRTA